MFIDSTSDLISVLGSYAYTYGANIRNVPEIAQCVNLRSRLVSRIPLVLYKGDQLLDNHYLQDVINHPSQQSTLAGLLTDIDRDILLNRYSLLRLVRNTQNQTIAMLHVKCKDWSFVNSSDTNKISVVDTTGKRINVNLKTQSTSATDYYVLFDFGDRLLDNLSLEIEEYTMIKTSRISRLRNTPDISMVIDLSKSGDVTDPSSLTPHQKTQIESNRAKEVEKVLGPQNVGKVMMAFGTPHMVNASVKESDFNDSIKAIKQTICSMFGMSLADLGHTENVNLANAGSMHAHLFNTVVSTDIELICQQISLAFQHLGELQVDERIWPDYSEVPAMQQLEEAAVSLQNDQLDLLNKQIDTINKLISLGYSLQQACAITGFVVDAPANKPSTDTNPSVDSTPQPTTTDDQASQ